MPHALTEREKAYLQFLRDYISRNENTPQLKDVADHFGVKAPSAHKVLEALQSKEYLIYRRGSKSGYYIRLAERGGRIEKAIEIMITGNINEYGEVIDFPIQVGHFPVVLMGVDENRVFALKAQQDIPQERIRVGDYLICDIDKRPQPGDIALLPFGKSLGRQFLCRIYSLTLGVSTLDKELDDTNAVSIYPVPETLLDPTNEQKLKWAPISYNRATEAYLLAEAEKAHVSLAPIPPELAIATMLRLVRQFPSHIKK